MDWFTRSSLEKRLLWLCVFTVFFQAIRTLAFDSGPEANSVTASATSGTKPVLTTPPPSKDVLAQGKYMFNVGGCNACHTSNSKMALAGGDGIVTSLGTFYPPNISPDTATGIGNWTDAQFLKALREGLSPKGEHYYPSFPYTNFSKMTDADILAIKAYIFSLPAINNPSKSNIVKFPFSNRSLLWFWNLFNFQDISDPDEHNFVKARGPFKPIAGKSDVWNRGAYLVEGPLHCTQCHTPRDSIGGFRWHKWMAGNKLSATLTAPNLTPDAKTGLGDWALDDWNNFMVDGLTPDGTTVEGDMATITRVGLTRMTDTDKAAVITYLQSLKPVENNVDDSNAQQDDETDKN